MAKTNSIPIETLRQLLDYNPETGELTWRPRPVEMFKSGGHNSQLQNAKTWNTRFAGKLAFTVATENRHSHGNVLGVQLYAHRIIWALEKGEWPENEIDHGNHIKTDNKFKNLDSVTRTKNMQNMPLQSRNTSGHCGVHWCNTNKAWIAKIMVNGKPINLGQSKIKSKAIAFRKAAEIKYGFHPNHGLSEQETTQAQRCTPKL